jgi:cytochrome c553
MKQLSALSAIAALICTLALAAPAQAGGDAERGKAKAAAVCAACHAVGGDWNKPLQPEYPKLAGQHYDYLVTALNAYKQGDKSVIGRKNAVMAPMAKTLSKQDIEDVAAFLSKLDGDLKVRH